VAVAAGNLDRTGLLQRALMATRLGQTEDVQSDDPWSEGGNNGDAIDGEAGSGTTLDSTGFQLEVAWRFLRLCESRQRRV
jgi:hypothetical protein